MSTEAKAPAQSARTPLARFLQASSPRARSLLVTLFGDAVTTHGGVIWLGSLVKLARPFGLNERLVRTAVFRLTREQWLQARSRGRRRFYELTERGRRSFESADKRIYTPPEPYWDGHWRMVLADHERLPASERQQLRRELLWRGYAALQPGLYAHPTDSLDAAREFCAQMGLSMPVIMMLGRPDDAGSTQLQQRFLRAASLDTLAQQYRDLHQRLAPFDALAATLDDEQAFVLRTLLVHEFRRILLRDPCLPPGLLPDDWPGDLLRARLADIYGSVLDASERFLHCTAEHEHGSFEACAQAHTRRFSNATPAQSKACGAATA